MRREEVRCEGGVKERRGEGRRKSHEVPFFMKGRIVEQ